MDDTLKADQLDIKVRVSSRCHEVQSEYLQPDTGMDSAASLELEKCRDPPARSQVVLMDETEYRDDVMEHTGVVDVVEVRIVLLPVHPGC